MTAQKIGVFLPTLDVLKVGLQNHKFKLDMAEFTMIALKINELFNWLQIKIHVLNNQSVSFNQGFINSNLNMLLEKEDLLMIVNSQSHLMEII